MAEVSNSPQVESSSQPQDTLLEQGSMVKTTFYTHLPPTELADDGDFVQNLTHLINSVYILAEEGLFNDQYVRISSEEVRKLLTSRELALASTSHDSPWSPLTNIVGCIRIVQESPSMGEWGTLAAVPETRGSGLGRQLVDFAEKQCRGWGALNMQIQLLVPTTFTHPLKSWIQPWYERLGYEVIRTEDFGRTYPKLAPLLKTPVEYRVFEKRLQ